MPPRRFKRRAAGFTLLEVLAALALSGLIAAIAFSSLYGVQRLRQWSVQSLQAPTAGIMNLEWFRRSAAAVMTLPSAGAGGGFQGDGTGFAAVSLAPLFGDVGAPTATAWRLAVGAAPPRVGLQYRQADGPWRTVAEWPYPAAAFSYADDAGAWRGDWPPGGGVFPAVPAYIRLDVGQAERGDALRPLWSMVVRVDPPPPLPPLGPRP